jgi:hypothetical protein
MGGVVLLALAFIGSVSGTALLILAAAFSVGGTYIFSFLKRRARGAQPAETPASPAPSVTAPRTPVTERRRSHRRTVTPVMVKLASNYDPNQVVEGVVLNVSTHGLGLMLKQPVEVGSTLYIRAATAPPAVPWLAVEIKHCTPVTSRWHTGCAYVEPPSEEVRLLFG